QILAQLVTRDLQCVRDVANDHRRRRVDRVAGFEGGSPTTRTARGGQGKDEERQKSAAKSKHRGRSSYDHDARNRCGSPVRSTCEGTTSTDRGVRLYLNNAPRRQKSRRFEPAVGIWVIGPTEAGPWQLREDGSARDINR